MATNESLNQFGSILKDLLDIGGKGIKEGVSDKQEVDESQAKELMKGLGKITDLSPVALLGKLLGTASAVPDIQNARQESQRVNQMAEERKEPEVVEDPITKARKAPALKLIGQQSEQMLKSGTTPEQLIANADEANQKQQSQNPQSEPGQLEKALGGQPEDQEKKLGLLGKLSEMFKTGMEAGHGAVDPNYVTRQLQKQELEQGGKLGIQKAKSKQTMFLEDFKQNRQDQRERIKASLSSGDFEALKDPEIFVDNLTNMVNAFDDVNVKGRFGLNILGAIGGAVGIDRADREKYNYWSEMFSYNLGGFVAGQLGRSLTENERELIKKASVPKLSGGKDAFRGKTQGIIDSANSVLRRNGKATLPDAKTFISMIKSGKGKNLSNMIKNTERQQQMQKDMPVVKSFSIIE